MISRSDDLEILLAVVDSGGFSAAAELLGIQVARASRAVTRLEQQLGTTLLNRTTRRIELSEDGRIFVVQIRDGLARLEGAEEQLRLRHQAPAGTLRIDAASPFVLHQLVPHIQAFRKRYPQIELALTTSEGVIDLLEKRTDVAIRIGELQDSSLHSRFLGRSGLHLVASPDYLENHPEPVSSADISAHDCIGFTAPASLNDWPVGPGIRIVPALSASSGEVIRQLCLAGQGIACLSRFMIADDLAAGHLIPLLTDQMQSPHPREQVQAVYYRNTALSARITAFLDFIQPRLVL